MVNQVLSSSYMYHTYIELSSNVLLSDAAVKSFAVSGPEIVKLVGEHFSFSCIVAGAVQDTSEGSLQLQDHSFEHYKHSVPFLDQARCCVQLIHELCGYVVSIGCGWNVIYFKSCNCWYAEHDAMENVKPVKYTLAA